MDYSDAQRPPRRMMELLQERYAFLSILGHGGSSTVYEVRNLQLDRAEALKVLNNSMSPDTTRRFAQEAKISASLDHPGIVRIYDFGQLEGATWYSMQLIDGPSLSTLIESKIRLDATGVSRLGVSILDALAYSHKHGIIHRDIKPANIMIQPSGYPCLTDFGIAKFTGASDFTQTGSMMGTPAYMAPEQAEGKPVDGRADQYSLAITLYRAITGKLPFSTDEPMATLVLRLKEDPEPIELHRPEFPEPIRRVLMKALSRNRDDRYATIEDMQKELQLAAATCNIFWNRPFEGYEHRPILRMSFVDGESRYFYDIDPTAHTRKPAGRKNGLFIWIFGIAVVASILAIAALYFKTSESTVSPPQNQATESTDNDSPIDPPVRESSSPPSSASAPSAVAPQRRAVTPAVLTKSELPDSLVIPPELNGKIVPVRVTIGEDGKVVRCTILSRDLSPEEAEIAKAVAMNLEFSPALSEDGLPVTSELATAITLGRTS
ncbi:MAG: protein kinase [Holophagaceae bacterium]|nr:protein kinase [Holophagaceae bacterium]